MRKWVLLSAAASLPAAPASATDHLLFGKPEAWVVPVTTPAPPPADDSSAFTNLLDNEQAILDRGLRKFFSESVYRINSPQGLDDGNIRLTWDPAVDTVTVHKLLIRRGSQVIDVLASGQKFTTLRRETNLEAGMLDGELTATLLPEGLQVGDIIDLAVTYVHADPVTRNSAEVGLATFNGSPIGRGFARLSWPSSLPVTFRTTGGLPMPKATRSGGISSVEYDMKDIEPLLLPNQAPGRFRDQRSLDASTFARWADVGAVMKPYFDAAAAIPASGPLRDEVEKIKHLPGTDKLRAEAALRFVEDNVRYVALSMGTGGYIPASAETTWSRRFGDCKAKTALLLAILHELHIDSEPVLANTDGNDGLDTRQPQLGWFNHVLVRARIDGKTYWLDGTRSGDISLDRLKTPAFDWGLPLVANADLVRMVPDPLTEPSFEVALSIDAREGIRVPAPATLVYTFRGDSGQQANIRFNAMPPSQRDRFLREFFKSAADDWKTSLVSLEPQSVKAEFDPATGVAHWSMTGTATLDWSGNNFYLEFSSVAYKPNFQRTEGVNREAPIAIDYPKFAKLTESVRLPKSFLSSPPNIPDIDATLVGVQYHRHIGLVGDAVVVEDSERSLVSEVPYAQAMAQAGQLRKLNDNPLSLSIPSSYRATDKELAALQTEKPTTYDEFIERGETFFNRERYDEAIADFTSAIALDHTKVMPFAERGLAYVWKGDNEHARADIAAATAIDPKEPVMLRAKGLLAENERKWQDAIDAYTASLAKDPDNSFALGHRAIDYSASNHLDEALSDAAAALEKSPRWYGLHQIRAGVFLKRHQCPDVLKEAKGVVDSAPEDPDALLLAARLHVLCQDRTQGFALFGKALDKKPSGLIYINRADSRPPEDHAGKLADIEAAIKLEPKETGWVLTKADEMDRVGDHAAALELYDQVLKLEPQNFGAAAGRAVELDRLGRQTEALKIFAALRTKAKKAVELNNLCWTKATAGIFLDSALSDCNEALKLEPDAPSYLDSLGMTLLRLGRYDEAIKAYDKAIAAGTGAVSLMGRSIAYARKGDTARADADKKAAVADDPEIAERAKRFGLDF